MDIYEEAMILTLTFQINYQAFLPDSGATAQSFGL